VRTKVEVELRMVFTAKAAATLLGVTPQCSPCEARRAYRRQLLKAHPDKGGSPEAFNRVRRAWDILSRAKCFPRARSLRTGNKASNKPAARVHRVQPDKSPKQGSTPSRLCSVHFQTQHSSLFAQSADRKIDLLDTWRKDLLRSVKQRELLVQEVGGSSSSNPLSSVAKNCFTKVASDSTGTLSSASRIHPTQPMCVDSKVVTTSNHLANSQVNEVVTTTSCLSNGLVKEAETATKRKAQGRANEGEIAPWMKLALLGSMGRSARTRKNNKRRAPTKEHDSKRRKLAAKATSRNSEGNALAQHIQAERAAADAAAKNDRGRLTEVRCPMLARHLREERVAIAAAEVEQQQQQQQQNQQQQPDPQSPSATTTTDGTSESSVFETKLGDLAAKLRATPREERRRLLMELPKATRASLEAFLLAGRKVSELAPAHTAGSIAPPGGEVPQSAACGHPATAKVEDVRAQGGCIF